MYTMTIGEGVMVVLVDKDVSPTFPPLSDVNVLCHVPQNATISFPHLILYLPCPSLQFTLHNIRTNHP